jgi:hypothetical protein
MSRQEDKRIAALAKKNAAKIKPPAADQSAQFDQTLRKKPPEETEDTKRLFKEMSHSLRSATKGSTRDARRAGR